MKLAGTEIANFKMKDIKHFWILTGFLVENLTNLDFSIFCSAWGWGANMIELKSHSCQHSRQTVHIDKNNCLCGGGV